MALMEWKPEMSVEVAVIDEEHKKLVALINELYDGVRSGKGRDTLGTVLDGLIHYTVEHFRHEECFFEQTHYPEIDSHKREHAALTKKVQEIQEKFKAGGGTVLTLEVMEFLKSWLINHIQGTDKRYTEHLHNAGVR